MIHNPILPGFNPDPCICRKGDDYYIAVSTFEWFPGIPVYHSRDLKHWELLTHVLTDDEKVNLKKLPSAKGIWAPCLTYCEAEDLFYVVYGVMNSMNARYFDVDNFLITAKDICGPWSEPVYLHSAGFDASILHDDDGRKYIVSLDWETRAGYEKPGAICMVEYSPKKQEIIGYPKRIWRGGTVEITTEQIRMVLADVGPGIPDVELAMQAGYSTAPDEIRSLGFGAGMGLPNMKKYSDQMEIDTRLGEGTTITMTVKI